MKAKEAGLQLPHLNRERGEETSSKGRSEQLGEDCGHTPQTPLRNVHDASKGVRSPQEQLLNLMVSKRPRPSSAVPAPPGAPHQGVPHPPARTPSNRRALNRTWQNKQSLQSASLASCPTEKKTRWLEKGQIFDLFYWEEILQEEGNGGKVVVCQPKGENMGMECQGFKYVMKIKSKAALRRDKHEEQFIRSQLRLLNLKAPPGVIQLREVCEDDNFYYVVMDRATGGPFFTSLLQEHRDGTMPAEAVCKVAKDILETLSCLHREGILHRDIKPDNMVMHSNRDAFGREEKKVTLIDFDHADADFSMGLSQTQHCFGTARFNAPEAFLGFYSAATDLYSVGVVTYLLLTGSMPYPEEFFDFDEASPGSPAANRRWMQRVLDQMEAYHVDWSHPSFMDSEAKDFCQSLLAFHFMDRTKTADQALRHPWLEACAS